MGKVQLKFSLSLVAVIVLIAVVVGLVAGRAAGGTSSSSGGGGSGGATAGKKVDVIIKASNSSFWQTMLAGSSKASKDFGIDVGLFGPAQEIDIPEQVTLVENAVSRGVDAVVLAPNSSNALNNAIKQARKSGVKVVVVDTGVTTDTDGFIGTDNIKAGEQAGKTLCGLAKAQNKATGSVMIESSVAGVQTIKERETGFRRGLAASCPGLKVATTRYNDDKTDKAVSDVNDVLTANPGLVGIFASNVTSGVGVARGVKDNNAAGKIPVVAFDTDPQENAALADGSIDALIVQNPYFFGYQGVVEAAMASVGSLPPPKLDPGAVVATTKNMNDPTVKPLLNPPTAKAQS